MAASLLTLLGLGPEEDSVYRQLVDHPDSEPGAFTGQLTPDERARALAVLVERGRLAALTRKVPGPNRKAPGRNRVESNSPVIRRLYAMAI
ncbi:hypothetical protein [Streptomyces sp. NPDC058045]|uniref:hypothetical protein n=1 Tax=Streptomyces sp. NPDC058045 TaxID=3346311 RepID=UPI0036E31517